MTDSYIAQVTPIVPHEKSLAKLMDKMVFVNGDESVFALEETLAINVLNSPKQPNPTTTKDELYSQGIAVKSCVEGVA